MNRSIPVESRTPRDGWAKTGQPGICTDELLGRQMLLLDAKDRRALERGADVEVFERGIAPSTAYELREGAVARASEQAHP